MSGIGSLASFDLQNPDFQFGEPRFKRCDAAIQLGVTKT
jgi:hypothetical protein